VLTGGGSQLKHIKQLAEYVTGMPSRIGYPNEHLAGDSDTESTSPLFATAVGLVMKGLEDQFEEEVEEEVVEAEVTDVEQPVNEVQEEERPTVTEEIKKKGIFDSWATKFKEFLDKAE
ncbi:cell division protein FtsA, partial [Nonlabens dokdonensis]